MRGTKAFYVPRACRDLWSCDARWDEATSDRHGCHRGRDGLQLLRYQLTARLAVLQAAHANSFAYTPQRNPHAARCCQACRCPHTSMRGKTRVNRTRERGYVMNLSAAGPKVSRPLPIGK